MSFGWQSDEGLAKRIKPLGTYGNGIRTLYPQPKTAASVATVGSALAGLRATRILYDHNVDLAEIYMRILAIVLSAILVSSQVFGSQTLQASAYQDAQGHITTHSASGAVARAAPVTCVSASHGPGPTPPGIPVRASCYVTVPGFHGDLQSGQTIGTSGAGSAFLTCDGYPYPLQCAIRIDD